MLRLSVGNPKFKSTIRHFTAALRIQARCLYALMIRQMMLRYGRDNLGFLWVFVEPMLLCTGVMIIWSLIRDSYEHGIGIIQMALTGYMPLTLWRHLTNSGVFVFRASINLLYHPYVSLLDAFFTRIALEFVGTTAAFVLVAGTLMATGLIDPPEDLGLIAAGWMLMGLLSTGVAILISVLTESSEISERFIPVFQYLALPLCGCFYLVDWLPTYAQKMAWFIPTVHCYEMIRAGFFGNSVETYYDAWYPAAWGFGLFALGVGLIENVRDRIHA